MCLNIILDGKKSLENGKNVFRDRILNKILCDNMGLNEKLKKLHEDSDNYYENRDYENLLICLNKIHEIDPEDLDNIENMAGVNLILKRFSRAIEIAETLPEDCWMRYIIIGHYYNELEQNEDAIKSFLKAHNLNSKHKKPLFNLAFAYSFQKDYEKALEYAFKMLELDKNDIDALALLINQYFYMRQFEKVIEYSIWALDISDERDVDIYPPLAFSYLMTGEPQKGWDCIVEAIFKHPDDISYYVTLGTYSFAINDDKKALQIYNTAHLKNPSSPEPFLGLAMHYKSTGDLKKAREYYEKYVELENDCVMGFDEF